MHASLETRYAHRRSNLNPPSSRCTARQVRFGRPREAGEDVADSEINHAGHPSSFAECARLHLTVFALVESLIATIPATLRDRIKSCIPIQAELNKHDHSICQGLTAWIKDQSRVEILKFAGKPDQNFDSLHNTPYESTLKMKTIQFFCRCNLTSSVPYIV